MIDILILEGGFNEEHKVSLATSSEIKKVLNKKNIKYKTLLVNPKTFYKDINKYSNKLICFNCLHGTFGEDGTIQKILKIKNFKFTHSGINSSKLCFDKFKSKKKVSKIKVPILPSLELKLNFLNRSNLYKFRKKFNKYIIKPNRSGSSFGVIIIKSKEDIENLISKLNKYKKKLTNHDTLIIEKYIEGKELTVSVLKIDKKTKALDVTEIISKNNFFDYKAKYTKGFSKHILPAKIPIIVYKKCLKFALQAHKVLKCNAISRTDFIYDKKNNKIFYLETNTQPGLTSVSLVPEQAIYKNLSFEKIVFELIKYTK